MRPLCSFLRGTIIVEKKHSVPNVIWGVFTRFSSLAGLYGLPKGGHLPIVDVHAGACRLPRKEGAKKNEGEKSSQNKRPSKKIEKIGRFQTKKKGGRKEGSSKNTEKCLKYALLSQKML